MDLLIWESCFKVSLGKVYLAAMQLLNPLVDRSDEYSVTELSLRLVIRRTKRFLAEGLASGR